ncbi:hypothetical protein ACRALDRAFT_2020893 [Sodiomyces alcalophilus JCM 7366]|uniref:uncharacterized protein n=1 Tax=Sodiomyces alcalophilus JCM 7366 TaxID=591952 RepID=UPI0039B442FA
MCEALPTPLIHPATVETMPSGDAISKISGITKDESVFVASTPPDCLASTSSFDDSHFLRLAWFENFEVAGGYYVWFHSLCSSPRQGSWLLESTLRSHVSWLGDVSLLQRNGSCVYPMRLERASLGFRGIRDLVAVDAVYPEGQQWNMRRVASEFPSHLITMDMLLLSVYPDRAVRAGPLTSRPASHLLHSQWAHPSPASLLLVEVKNVTQCPPNRRRERAITVPYHTPFLIYPTLDGGACLAEVTRSSGLLVRGVTAPGKKKFDGNSITRPSQVLSARKFEPHIGGKSVSRPRSTDMTCRADPRGWNGSTNLPALPQPRLSFQPYTSPGAGAFEARSALLKLGKHTQQRNYEVGQRLPSLRPSERNDLSYALRSDGDKSSAPFRNVGPMRRVSSAIACAFLRSIQVASPGSSIQRECFSRLRLVSSHARTLSPALMHTSKGFRDLFICFLLFLLFWACFATTEAEIQSNQQVSSRRSFANLGDDESANWVLTYDPHQLVGAQRENTMHASLFFPFLFFHKLHDEFGLTILEDQAFLLPSMVRTLASIDKDMNKGDWFGFEGLGKEMELLGLSLDAFKDTLTRKSNRCTMYEAR